MVKGEPLAKHSRDGDESMPMVKEDDAMTMVKEEDVVPVVNQDEVPVDPFGDRDDWAVSIMSKAFLKIRHLL